MSVQVIGIKQLADNLKNIMKDFDKNLEKGLIESAEMILDASKDLAPKKTGEMIRQTDINKVDSKNLEVRYNTDYSLYVHEDLNARHPNGRAKFLQIATTENGKKAISKISRGLL